MRAAWSWPPGRVGHKIDWPWLARGAAALHLLALGLIVTMAWQDQAGAVAGGLPALHLVLLMATGTAAAFLLLGPGEGSASPAAEHGGEAVGTSQLLAQMSHELRTPLNAVIGFSEVMQNELLGPLGHARYQEYAAYISESGGRLLRASEDALAVATSMSALVAVRRERVLAATLLQAAWVAVAAGRSEIQFAVVNGGCEIECDWRATGQALEHVLREAISRTPPGGTVVASGRRRGDGRSIEINVWPLEPSQGAPSVATYPVHGLCERGDQVAGGGLRVILARSLLEMQGATLDLGADPAAFWSASFAFPSRGSNRMLI